MAPTHCSHRVTAACIFGYQNLQNFSLSLSLSLSLSRTVTLTGLSHDIDDGGHSGHCSHRCGSCHHHYIHPHYHPTTEEKVLIKLVSLTASSDTHNSSIKCAVKQNRATRLYLLTPSASGFIFIDTISKLELKNKLTQTASENENILHQYETLFQ